MKLTIEDRLVIMGCLPSQADYATLIHVKDIRGQIELTSDEIEKIDFQVVEGTGMKWDKEKAEEIDFEFNPKQLGVVADALEKMSKENKLTLAHIPTYEKFCT